MSKTLFPHGFGTRAFLAVIVVVGAVGAALYYAQTEKLLEMALIVLSFYFIGKATNGNSAPKA